METRQLSQNESGARFEEKLSAWNRETAYLSVANFNNPHFDDIVNMPEAAVPFIYAALTNGPTLLAHARDKIYPGKVTFEGYVPLSTICNVWLNILSKTVGQ